ncbi:MAG: rhodanese-like domain-containing protein [Methanobacterium sp.]|nr:rhodanese-like domain-containing protein [Methanobacterium sp.]
MFGKKNASNNEIDLDPNSAWEIVQDNQDNSNFVILDVRTPGEYEESHIEGSVLINYQSPDFKDEIQKLDKDKTYLVYCRSGMRGAACIDVMMEAGFKKIYNIDGGIMGWENSGLPVK